MVRRKVASRSRYRLPQGARNLGRIAPRLPITVSVYFKDREESAQRTTRRELSERRAGDHSEDIRLFRQFAAAHGLGVVAIEPARRLLKLAGPAAAMEQAFGTELHHYVDAHRNFRARSGPLSLPRELADCVLAVLGLEDRRVARARQTAAAASAPPTGMLPTEIAALYGFPEEHRGDGQAIALLEFGGGYNVADMEVAAQAMDLPLPPITPVSVHGVANSPGSPDDVEVTLDIQIAMGAAPGAHLVVYFSTGDEMGMVDAVTAAIHDELHAPSVVSLSWGSPEVQWSKQGLTAMDQAFVDAARLGVTVICASGDNLAGGGLDDGTLNVDFPASSPNALACGGTRLVIDGGRLAGELVWNANGRGTGGGVSVEFPLPPYQQPSKPPKSSASGKAGRAVPDFAANADPATGYRIHLDGQWGPVGGTSAATPLWAGLVARVNEVRAQAGRPQLGHFASALYGSPGTLAAVTDGNNFIPGTELGYRAGVGFNCCTGLGTPAAPGLFEFLVQVPG